MHNKIFFFLILIFSSLITLEVNANFSYCFKNLENKEICTNAVNDDAAINQFDYIKSSNRYGNESILFSGYDSNKITTGLVDYYNEYDYSNNNENISLFVEKSIENNESTTNTSIDSENNESTTNASINNTPTNTISTPNIPTNTTKVKNKGPEVNCIGLPGCVDKDITNPSPATATNNVGSKVITNIIGQVIQFVAVIAVIALILSGIMYLVSGGDEEKVKKAKSWITWSLVGVILSISAWGIINMLNTLTIGK